MQPSEFTATQAKLQAESLSMPGSPLSIASQQQSRQLSGKNSPQPCTAKGFPTRRLSFGGTQCSSQDIVGDVQHSVGNSTTYNAQLPPLPTSAHEQNQPPVLYHNTHSHGPGPNCSDRNLIINHIPVEVTEEELCQVFSQYGEVDRVKIVYDSMGHTKGYGFVRFREPQPARLALEGLTGFEMYGKRLRIDYAVKPSAMQPTSSVAGSRIYIAANAQVPTPGPTNRSPQHPLQCPAPLGPLLPVRTVAANAVLNMPPTLPSPAFSLVGSSPQTVYLHATTADSSLDFSASSFGSAQLIAMAAAQQPYPCQCAPQDLPKC